MLDDDAAQKIFADKPKTTYDTAPDLKDPAVRYKMAVRLSISLGWASGMWCAGRLGPKSNGSPTPLDLQPNSMQFGRPPPPEETWPTSKDPFGDLFKVGGAGNGSQSLWQGLAWCPVS